VSPVRSLSAIDTVSPTATVEMLLWPIVWSSQDDDDKVDACLDDIVDARAGLARAGLYCPSVDVVISYFSLLPAV
jgi:hypothetical protein